MSTSSLLSTFPIEIVHEIIRNSDVSTLAKWCLVSKGVLSFAGPLLHKIVTLKRPQDIVPFLERLVMQRRHARAQPAPSSSPFPFLSFLKRLEIQALPISQLDLRRVLPSGDGRVIEDVVLAVGCWTARNAADMVEFWVPALVLCVQPVRYEELGRRGAGKDIYFSGELLSFYYQRVDQLPLLNDGSAGDIDRAYLYQQLSKLASNQIEIDADVQSCETAISCFSLTPSFSPPQTTLNSTKEFISLVKPSSILEDHGGEWNSLEILKERLKEVTEKWEELSEAASTRLEAQYIASEDDVEPGYWEY